MIWLQKTLSLAPKSRGFHLITQELLRQLPELKQLDTGQIHFFLKHTSASISINENADATVRADMERYFNVTVPEKAHYFEHTCEGPDDMPAHIKSVLLGCELTVPVEQGELLMGTWQGIYLGEHRNHGGSRQVVATLSGLGYSQDAAHSG
jgi:secondary thiamine-phosphate synthase enzyme